MFNNSVKSERVPITMPDNTLAKRQLGSTKAYAIFFDSIINSPLSESALNRLQERWNLNRNFIIFCIWFAKTGRGRLRRAVMRERLHALFVWNQAIVNTLQQLLDTLTAYLPHSTIVADKAEQLKRTVAKTYKQAEQLCLLNETSLYYATQHVLSRQVNDAIANLLGYIALVKAHYLDKEDNRAFITLLHHVFPEVEVERLTGLWSAAFNKHIAGGSRKLEQHYLKLIDAPARTQ